MLDAHAEGIALSMQGRSARWIDTHMVEEGLREFRQARAAVADLVAAAESVLAISENASFESGYCCCGDEMRSHAGAYNCGHTPTDSGAYYGGSAISELRASLAAMGADK